MRYQHLKTIRKINIFLLPALPLLIACIFVVTKAQVPLFATNFVHKIAVPVWSARDFLTSVTNNLASSFTGKEQLIEENTRLREELLSRTRETFTTRALTKENLRLRELLDRAQAQPELLPAAVIHGNSFSPYDTFFIDQGVREGIRDNMLVVTPENITVGYISKTLEHTSIVTQFSASEQTFDVLLSATSTTHLNLRGFGSGTMRITTPRDTNVEIGDTVTLPSFVTYTLGTVVSIEVSPEDAYKMLYIQSPVNSYELRYILIDTTSIWSATQTETEEETV